MTHEQKLAAVALAFMNDDPEEYEGETLEQVIEEMKGCSIDFIDAAYMMFCAEAE